MIFIMNKHTREVVPIETPVLTYEHSESQSRIDLFGAVHIAEAEYYKTMQEKVGERAAAGAAVQFEMVRVGSDVDISNASRLTLWKMGQIAHGLGTLFELVKGLDSRLIHQRDGLNYHEDWENVDTTHVDIARRFSIRGVVKLRLVSLLLSEGLDIENEDFKRAFFSALGKSLGGSSETGSSLLGSKKDNAVIVDYRNRIALEGVDEKLDEAPGGDIALIWGAGHIPGLEAGLLGRGYRKVEEEKILAIDAPRLLETAA